MADTARLLSDATEAFVDRAPIDWPALLSRVGTSPDRALFESLQTLSTVRDSESRAGLRGDPHPRTSVAARIIVALGAAQTVGLFILILGAVASGESVGDRGPQVILALAFALASIPLGMATFRDPRSVFLLAAYTSAASVFARSATSGLPAFWTAPVDRVLGGLRIEAFVPATVWLFALDFPTTIRFTRFDYFGRRAALLVSVLGVGLFVINIGGAYFPSAIRPLDYVLRDHTSQLFWRLLSASVAPALVAILVRSRWAPTSERRRVVRLASVIACGTGPFLALALVRTAVPAVNDWFSTGESAGAVGLYNLIVAALAATPILSVAAVVADRPFEFQTVLRRTSRYALAKGALTGLVLVPTVVLAVAIVTVDRPPMVGILDDLRARLLIGCACGGALLLTARARLLAAVARSVSRRALHDDRMIAIALDRLSGARGRRETLAGLERELRVGVGLDDVRVFLRRFDGVLVDWSRPTVAMSGDSGLLAMLQDGVEPLDLSPDGAIVALLPARDRDWVAANGIHLAAAWRRAHGPIGAVVTLGAKPGGFPFDRRDRVVIMTLLAAATAAFDELDEKDSASTGRVRRSDDDEVAFECPECGTVAPTRPLRCDCHRDPTLAALPALLAGKFEVLRRIGAGGMGIVYLARDAALSRHVALKTLPRLRPDAVRQLRDEARAMAALNHESVATIYGLELWRRTPVLVVEYFPGGTLARRLSMGPMSAPHTIALGCRLASALGYIHDSQLLHRDLKPSNVAFTATGSAKLMDFGLATLSSPLVEEDDDGHDSGGIAGTLAYMSPEARNGAAPSAAGDLWALAVIVLEAATGANPFAIPRGSRGPHRMPSVDVAAFCRRHLSATPTLAAFFATALHRSAAHRFAGAREFHDALAAARR